MITTKKDSKLKRWEILQTLIKEQISNTNNEPRLRVLLNRLNTVCRDNRNTNRANCPEHACKGGPYPFPPFEPITFERLLEWKKVQSTAK